METKVKPHVWLAIAGKGTPVPPAVGSLVYYFPQGHAEQTTIPPDFTKLPRVSPCYRCKISAVEFLASRDTDEVFIRYTLEPIMNFTGDEQDFLASDDVIVGGDSFEKVLTPSDANNGGGFSVPRGCADLILPPLDFQAEIPLQQLQLRDVHGELFDFRHIYRGKPLRHLLTTGWSKFINSKRLAHGDAVSFVRTFNGELFLGINRSGRFLGPLFSSVNENEDSDGVDNGGDGDHVGTVVIPRNLKGRITPKTVVEAVKLAEMGKTFEVLYYPRAGPEFVVRKRVVEAAMMVCWTAGTRVKMEFPSDCRSRMCESQGVVSSATVAQVGMWAQSPWRMLQVSWDDIKLQETMSTTNPWQVELVSASPHIQNPFPTLVTRNTELLGDITGGVLLPLGAFGATIDSSMPTSYNYNIFPAGIRGARHDQLLSALLPNVLNSDNVPGGDVPQKSAQSGLSTELRMSSTSQSESLSPPSHDSVLCQHQDSRDSRRGSPTKKAEVLKLFGKVIHTSQQT